MSKYRLDPITKEMAEDYANEEARINGWKIGSNPWKNAFKSYVSDAMATMSVGRNPRGPGSHLYKVKTELYPDVFGKEGFAGKVAKDFITESKSDKGVPLESMQNKILSSVSNLVRMYENGILGIRNTTVGNKQGKIPNNQMSEMQLPNKEEFSTATEFEAAVRDVILNWFVRDLITDAVLESLIPFFKLSEQDIKSILSELDLDKVPVKDLLKGGREELIKALRAKVKTKMDQVNYRKLVLS